MGDLRPGAHRPSATTAWVRFLAVVATLGLVVTGCSSPDEAPPPVATPNWAPAPTSTRRTPPRCSRAATCGWRCRASPNFNYLHIDGNVADFGGLLRWTLPRAFFIKPDGEMTVNSDYFTSVELTSTDPQVVTYTINPKAVWTDGTPITWEDFAAQINATSGKDDRFLFAAPNGSERVESVTKGVDDRQAVITFAQHYADWRGMFAGNSMLAPKSMTQDPEAFNRGFLNGPAPSAGRS